MRLKNQAFAIIWLFALLLSASCQNSQIISPQNQLYNETLNDQIDALTTPGSTNSFSEFYFNFSARQGAKYEFAGSDIFSESKGNLNASEVSVFGIMLGDSYEQVLVQLGVPDVMFIPADRSYRNLEYRNKIGIGGLNSGLVVHLENDTVTVINIKLPFNKYLVGNTSFGQKREFLYRLFGTPDYQDFTANQRVLHYVSLGFDFYANNDKTEVLSIKNPREFNGVKYVTARELLAEGVYGNVTRAILLD